ncbi:MAG: hypothetical protein SPG64_02315 [Candidatus Enteromonas sp.]|nr:hypothetical protein [Candidatus Enteromonas sp.]
MKLKHCLILPLVALLGACGTGEGNISSESGGEVSSLPSEPIESEEEVSLPDLSEVQYDLTVSMDGFLNDFLVGTPAIATKDYKLSFGFSSASTAGAVVKTDVPSVATAEKRGEYWYFVALKPGKTHLIIEDADGIIHLRTVLTVKKELSDAELDASLYEVDHWEVPSEWQGFCGNFTVTFFDDLSASMAGRESGGTNLEGVTFTMERDDSIISDGGVYPIEYWASYTVKNWPINDYVLSSVIVYRSGDQIHMHTNNTLLGILVPGEAK